MKTTTDTIKGAPLAALWRGFLAGASPWGADLPTALRPDLLDSIAEAVAAFPVILSAVAAVAVAREVNETEEVPAGFRVEVNPCRLTIEFGSGRSVIALHVSRYGDSTLEIGLCFYHDEMTDPGGARASAEHRAECARSAMVGL